MIKVKREVKIGFFALLMMFALYWGINFLKGQDLLQGTNTYYAVYDQVGGLQKSGSVFVKGYKVGVISDIIFDPRVSDKFTVEFTIKKKYGIPEDSKARVVSDGLLGGKAVNIILGESPVELRSGQTMISESDKDLLEVVGSEFEQLKRKLSAIFDDVTELTGNLNSLIADNAQHINSTMINISELTGSVNGVVKKERKDIEGIIASLNTISVTLADRAERIGGIVDNIGTFSDNLSEADVNALFSDLSATVGQLNLLLDSINEGSGSIGKLMTDDTLYESLNTSADNLARLLEDVRERPGRYVNISVFGGRNRD